MSVTCWHTDGEVSCSASKPHRRGAARQGLVLIVVLIVVAMLSLTGYTFGRLMFAERRAANTSARIAQARALAESGLELAKQFASLDPQSQLDLGGWYDNRTQFQGALVVDDDQAPLRGRVTLVAPLEQDGIASGIRYGLENESAKLNLRYLQSLLSSGTASAETTASTASGGNSGSSSASKSGEKLAKDMLMQLPGMTDDIADSILDWLDSDETTREYGAEAEYYSGLTPPYAPTNGVPGSIDELLLIRGVTPELLYGPDWNRNGLLDADEPTSVDMEGVDNTDGSMNGGWAALLTLDSAEANLKPDGTPKIDLNGSDLQQLYNDLQQPLGDEYAKFIVAFRQATAATGGPPGAPAQYTTPVSPGQLDPSKKAQNSFKTLLDVVGVNMGYKPSNTNPQTIPWQNPFVSDTGSMNTYMPKLLDNCYVGTASAGGGSAGGGSTDTGTTTSGTTSTVASTPGRININLALRAVLKTLLAIQLSSNSQPGAASNPAITEDVIDRIVGERVGDPTLDTADHQYVTWILTEGIVNLEQMKALMPYVTTGGNVFRATAVGFFEGGGPAARMEAVFDATNSPPTVLLWRDISPLGRGYPLEVLNPSGN